MHSQTFLSPNRKLAQVLKKSLNPSPEPASTTTTTTVSENKDTAAVENNVSTQDITTPAPTKKKKKNKKIKHYAKTLPKSLDNTTLNNLNNSLIEPLISQEKVIIPSTQLPLPNTSNQPTVETIEEVDNSYTELPRSNPEPNKCSLRYLLCCCGLFSKPKPKISFYESHKDFERQTEMSSSAKYKKKFDRTTVKII
jgi:hypothetical protein